MKKLAVLMTILAVFSLLAVSAFGEGIYVSSNRGDNIRVLEDMDITEPVNGNAIAVLGNITIDSRVNGHVISVFGDIKVNSEVSGQVVTVFGNTGLNSSALVMGDIITIGSISKAAGAQILGQEVRILGESMNLDIDAIAYLQIVIMILFTLASAVVGLLALLISKRKYSEISRDLEKYTGRKILLGILSFMGASALLLLLLVTLIAPLLYIVVLIMSTVTASMFFGRLILKTFSPKNSVYVEFITGLITITLIKLLIIFLVPQQETLLGLGLAGLFDMFVFSLGLGIHMEQRYLKNNNGNHNNKNSAEKKDDAKTA